MNWTSRPPLEGLKCIVETNAGCIFPAHYLNGTWWNTEKGFPIECVRHWIAYPEGEEPNDYIAPEVLLKYVMKAYRLEHAKLDETHALNQQLVREFDRMKKTVERLRSENERMSRELIDVRKQARKGRTLQSNLRRLLSQSAILDGADGEQNGDTIVA